MTDTLHQSIDTAIQSLLIRCTDMGTIGENIEAIQAASKWAEMKAKILEKMPAAPPSPPDPEKETKFEQYKREFHGGKKPGGRHRSRPAPDTGDGEALGDGATSEAEQPPIAAEHTDGAATTINGASADADTGQHLDG